MKTATSQRGANDAFLARGLHSAREARKDNQYIGAAAVVAELEKKLAAVKEKAWIAGRARNDGG